MMLNELQLECFELVCNVIMFEGELAVEVWAVTVTNGNNDGEGGVVVAATDNVLVGVLGSEE